MREIKFRAWMENKMLSHEDLVDMDQEFYAMYTILTEPQEDITFMQYTGLKDKDGREIYEGDIVNVNKYGGPRRLETVQFYTSGGGFLACHPFQDDGYHWASSYCEVIGNIYENPELLEESQNGTK